MAEGNQESISTIDTSSYEKIDVNMNIFPNKNVDNFLFILVESDGML